MTPTYYATQPQGSLSPYIATNGPTMGSVGSAPTADAYSSAGLTNGSSPTAYDPGATGFEEGLPDDAYVNATMSSAPSPSMAPTAGTPVSSGTPQTVDGIHTGMPANVADFAQLGVLSDQELQAIQASPASTDELGRLYDELVYTLKNDPNAAAQLQAQGQGQVQGQVQDPGFSQAPSPSPSPSPSMYGPQVQDPGFSQSPQYGYGAQGQGQVIDPGYGQSPQPGYGQGQMPAGAGAGGAGGAAGGRPAGGPPAWNARTDIRFRDAFEKNGIATATSKYLRGQLQALGLSKDEIDQAFQYYTHDPKGKREVKKMDAQMRAGTAKMNDISTAIPVALAGAGILGTAKLAKSQGNLVKALTHTALNGGEADSLAAQKMLHGLKTADSIKAIKKIEAKGRTLDVGKISKVDDVIRADAKAAIADTSVTTKRSLHPMRKMRLNGAVRNLTEGRKLTRAELGRYSMGSFPSAQEIAADAHAEAKAAHATAEASAPRHAAEHIKGGGEVAAKAGSEVSEVAKSGVTAGGKHAAVSAAEEGVEGLAKYGRLARFGSKALGPIGLAASAAFSIYDVKKSYDAEGHWGDETTKAAFKGGGTIAGGAAGAALGAAVGVGVLSVPLSIAGGVAGAAIGGWAGEHLGGLFT